MSVFKTPSVEPSCVLDLLYMFVYVCVNMFLCAYFRMRLLHLRVCYMMLRGASASCRIIQMLPSCLLIPPLDQLSPHRRDQNRTMPVRQPPFAVLEPRGKGQPSATELMKALLNSRSTKPCMSAVQNPVPSSCVSVSKPSGDLG